MTEHLTVENVDIHDRQAIIDWVEGMCSGLQVGEAAAALNTEPTVSAVAKELTEFLPDGIREEAASVCEGRLRSNMPGGSKRSQ